MEDWREWGFVLWLRLGDSGALLVAKALDGYAARHAERGEDAERVVTECQAAALRLAVTENAKLEAAWDATFGVEAVAA